MGYIGFKWLFSVAGIHPFAARRVFITAFAVATALILMLIVLNSASSVTLLSAGTVVRVAPTQCVTKYFHVDRASTLTGTLSSNLPVTLYVVFANKTLTAQNSNSTVYMAGPGNALAIYVGLQSAEYMLYLCDPNPSTTANVGVVDPVALR
jgi:hypothetical protein